jgi:hypothetical protein
MRQSEALANVTPISGKFGQRFNCPLPPADARPNAESATLAMHLIFMPDAHPAWDFYTLSLVHLRDIPGARPAVFQFPGATHELVVMAMDPETLPNPFKPAEFRFLQPVNVAVQFVMDGTTTAAACMLGDERAKAVAETIAQQCIDGNLPMEPQGLSGARELWRERVEFEASLLREIVADPTPVDRTARVLTDGSPVTDDHREISPRTGQQRAYVVLSPEERAKGNVRPVRRNYIHTPCGTMTRMSQAIAETYARDPGFYSGTFCVACRQHFPLDQFVWEGTTERVGS